MIQKVNETYYEMGFNLMSGLLVDETLKPQLEVVLTKCIEDIKKLVSENKEHILDTEPYFVYPCGQRTCFNLSAPKSQYVLDEDRKMKLLEYVFKSSEVKHVFKSDEQYTDKTKAYIQRFIEDEIINE